MIPRKGYADSEAIETNLGSKRVELLPVPGRATLIQKRLRPLIRNRASRQLRPGRATLIQKRLRLERLAHQQELDASRKGYADSEAIETRIFPCHHHELVLARKGYADSEAIETLTGKSLNVHRNFPGRATLIQKRLRLTGRSKDDDVLFAPGRATLIQKRLRRSTLASRSFARSAPEGLR